MQNIQVLGVMMRQQKVMVNQQGTMINQLEWVMRYSSLQLVVHVEAVIIKRHHGFTECC